MDVKFKQLLDRCKCGVHITVNSHRDYYQSAAESLEEISCMECPPSIDEDIKKIMIETNTIVNIHFYPDTPIGFYSIYHYDFDAALDQALACLD